MRQNKFCYKLTLRIISIENSDKQKSKITLGVEINQFGDGNCYTMRSSYAIDKI